MEEKNIFGLPVEDWRKLNSQQQAAFIVLNYLANPNQQTMDKLAKAEMQGLIIPIPEVAALAQQVTE